MSTVSSVRAGMGDQVTAQAVAGWSSVFPGCTALETEQQSLKFVKKMVTAVMSNVIYVRSIFPEEAFAKKTMDGVNLRILKAKSACDKAAMLSGWLLGAFDALEKKYLRTMMLVIYQDHSDPDLVHEIYTMKFTYPDGLATCELEGGALAARAATQRATGELLRVVLAATQTLGPLPEDAYLALKLTYHDERTPADYEPPGFAASDLGSLRVAGGSQSSRLGGVNTRHHRLQLKVTGPPADIDEAKTALVRDDYGCSQSQSQSQSQQAGGSPLCGPEQQQLEETGARFGLAAAADDGAPLPGLPATSPPAVVCTCGSSARDLLMLECVHCGREQHAACYRILREDQRPAEHCCAPCSRLEEGRVSTDSRLARRLDEPAVVTTCVFRRILASLVSRPMVDSEALCRDLGIEPEVADGAIVKLQQDGVVGGDLAVDQEVLLGTALPRHLGTRRERSGVPGLVRGAGELRLRDEPETEGRPPVKKMKMSKSHTMSAKF